MSAPTWPTPPATVADVIERVTEVLSAPKRWERNSIARAANGMPVGYDDPRACRWCLMGAVAFVTGGPLRATDRLFNRVLEWLRTWIGSPYVSDFNGRTTHAELLTVLDCALTGARRAGI